MLREMHASIEEKMFQTFLILFAHHYEGGFFYAGPSKPTCVIAIIIIAPPNDKAAPFTRPVPQNILGQVPQLNYNVSSTSSILLPISARRFIGCSALFDKYCTGRRGGNFP